MLEAGLVSTIQADPTVAALCPVGGFAMQLPPDQTLPSWRHVSISEQTDYLLSGPDSLRMRRIQIDCYGNTAAEAISLASAIDAVLSQLKRVTLPDSDATRVEGVFRSNLIDFFDDAARSYRRMVEYTVWYFQP
jgi:hypothetical protein